MIYSLKTELKVKEIFTIFLNFIKTTLQFPKLSTYKDK